MNKLLEYKTVQQRGQTYHHWNYEGGITYVWGDKTQKLYRRSTKNKSPIYAAQEIGGPSKRFETFELAKAKVNTIAPEYTVKHAHPMGL